MYVHKDPLQDQGSTVGRLLFIPGPQSPEAGARGGGKAPRFIARSVLIDRIVHKSRNKSC